MKGHSDVFAGLGVIAVLVVLSKGWLSGLRDHIRTAVHGTPSPTTVSNAPPTAPGVGTNPSSTGSGEAPIIKTPNANLPGLTSTTFGAGAPQPSNAGVPVTFAPGTFTLRLPDSVTGQGVSYVAIPDSTTTSNIYIAGIGVVRNWLQYLVSPMSHGNLTTHVS